MSNKYLKQAEARVGLVAHKWTLDSLIDVGGMASVYAASHRNGNRVAVKVLHRQYAKNDEAKKRFMREGYAANKVDHPAVVTVMDDDVLEDGTPFLVMELLEGQSLEGRLRHRGVIAPAEILYVADHVLDALAAAHEQGVIHRDIKPPNIFLTVDGGVKVLDFGLARVLEPDGFSMTRTGTVIGTASYMSPEQARGKRELIDHLTDIFAVGAVIFRALSGRNVHIAENPMDRLMAAMTDHAPSLAELAPKMPQDIVNLVDRALAFQKAERWPSARHMQQELRRIYQHHAGAVIPSAQENVNAAARWTAPPSEGSRRPSGIDDIHVSVVIEEPEGGDSIFVELDDGEGSKGRYQLRKRKSSGGMAASTDGELDEVSVVIDDE